MEDAHRSRFALSDIRWNLNIRFHPMESKHIAYLTSRVPRKPPGRNVGESNVRLLAFTCTSHSIISTAIMNGNFQER